MEKESYIEGRNDRLIRFDTGKTILFYGYWEEDGVGYCWKHTWYSPPSSSEVIDLINKIVNEQTDKKILNGYEWNNINVWLSSENLFNFKAAYDVAVLTNGAILPITFKLGEDSLGIPQYYTFEDMETFTNFYTGAITFIQQTLADGWSEKDNARLKFNLL